MEGEQTVGDSGEFVKGKRKKNNEIPATPPANKYVEKNFTEIERIAPLSISRASSWWSKRKILTLPAI